MDLKRGSVSSSTLDVGGATAEEAPPPDYTPLAPGLGIVAVALAKYNSPKPDQISFAKGERLGVTDSRGAWWQVRSGSGIAGKAPSNYLTIVAGPTAVSIARFNATKPDQASFLKGETVFVIDSSSAWWIVQNAAGKRGTQIVPTSLRSFHGTSPRCSRFAHIRLLSALFAVYSSCNHFVLFSSLGSLLFACGNENSELIFVQHCGIAYRVS